MLLGMIHRMGIGTLYCMEGLSNEHWLVLPLPTHDSNRIQLEKLFASFLHHLLCYNQTSLNFTFPIMTCMQVHYYRGDRKDWDNGKCGEYCHRMDLHGVGSYCMFF